MVVFSLLLEKCGEEYYYRYISENITYYIPSYKTDRLDKAVSNFEKVEGFTYSGHISDFLDTVYDRGQFTDTYKINDIRNTKELSVTLIGYRYNQYIILIGTNKSDSLLEETLFKEDYIFLVRWTNSKDEFIDDISNNVVSLLGYTREELLSKPYTDFIHPSDKDKFKEEFKSFIKQNSKSFYQRYRLVHSSGKAISILDHSCVITKDGESKIVGYLRDITLEVEMTTKITELKNLDEDSFNSSVIIKIEWDKDCKVSRWNKQACETLGWTNEVALGKHISELGLFNDEDSIKMQGQIHRLTSHEVESVVSNFKLAKKDGSLIDTKWSNRVINRDGESRVLSTIIDQSQEALLTTRIDEMEGRTDLLLKTLENTKMSNDVFSKLIHNPLTANPEGLIKAEIIIRKLEEEISRLNNTIFYNNDNNLLNDVAFLKNEDHVMRDKVDKIEESNRQLKNQLDNLLNVNVLSFFKNLDFKNIVGIVVVCYIIFGQFLPSIYPKIIRPIINDINKEMRQIEGKD